jgi:hypothetical protein
MATRCASDSARFHPGTSTGWPVQQDAFPGTLLAIEALSPADRSENGATDADEVEPERQCHRSVAHRYSQIRLRKRRKPVDDGGFDLPDFPQTGGSKPVISLTADDAASRAAFETWLCAAPVQIVIREPDRRLPSCDCVTTTGLSWRHWSKAGGEQHRPSSEK